MVEVEDFHGIAHVQFVVVAAAAAGDGDGGGGDTELASSEVVLMVDVKVWVLSEGVHNLACTSVK